jgi:hypothetical protein
MADSISWKQAKLALLSFWIMTVKSKGGSAALKRQHEPGPPKTTRDGYGQNSRPRRRGKKPLVGQGRG